jgi:hypothetical protein
VIRPALHILLMTVCLFLNSEARAAKLPTEEEAKGVQNHCGAGNIQAVAVKGDVDAAIENWRKASVGVDAEIAKKTGRRAGSSKE